MATDTTIDANSPTFLVDGSPRRISGFALPVSANPRFLRFSSKPYDGFNQPKTLVPVFVFLDAERRTLETVPSGAMVGGDTLAEFVRFEGTVSVPSAARHLIVSGTDVAPRPLSALLSRNPRETVSYAASRLGVLTLTVTRFGTATVRDVAQKEVEVPTVARLFYLASLDGETIEHAGGMSRRASDGKGFGITPVAPSRLVPAKAMKVVIVATHATGAPIEELVRRAAGGFHSVEALVDFTPEAGKVYVVNGDLASKDPAVWIEDAETGQPVTKKGTALDKPPTPPSTTMRSATSR